MSGLLRLQSTVRSGEVIAALAQDGAVIIEGFLSPGTLAGLRRDLLPQLEMRSNGRDGFSGRQTRRLGALFKHTRHCAEIVTNPLFLGAAEHYVTKPFEAPIGDNMVTMAAGVRIGFTQAIQIGPHQGAQVLHRDDYSFLWRHPTHGREARVQIMLAISDFTAENGGTLVIPGSHEWGETRKPQRSEAIPTIMAAGSALIFLGSVYHAGGENVTDGEYRTGLSIALDASHVRQEENMYLALTPDIVASYDEQVQRLLGWSAGSNAMGWVEVDGQMADPNDLLRGVRPEEVSAVMASRY